jgi:glutamyl-tRNA synthetase
LHIGGARTALFNWLYARHTKGKFLLRIEDTDRERSTEQAIHAIFESLRWLNLDWDEPPVFQFARAQRHAEVAKQLVAQGLAYYCYCSVSELEQMRTNALANGLPPKYNGLWRDNNTPPPDNVAPVIRFKAPQTGKTIITDMVQGTIELDNAQLDDMVLLRADGTPTYMLSVVVDDHDMGITHVIRGDDHLTNMFRQYHLFKACNWNAPQFAHIPLIHGPDGAKLSKRHGALGAEQYQRAGFLPEAMRNYLLRLGWAHGNDEIISTEQAVEWFDVCDVGRSPARFDLQKLLNLNGHYIRQADNQRLLDDICCSIVDTTSQLSIGSISQADKSAAHIEPALMRRLELGMNGLKERAQTLVELANNAKFYISPPEFNEDFVVPEKQISNKDITVEYLRSVLALLNEIDVFSEENINATIRQYCKTNDIKLGDFMAPIRVALTGSTVSPSLFEVIYILGRDETVARINTYISFIVSR